MDRAAGLILGKMVSRGRRRDETPLGERLRDEAGMACGRNAAFGRGGARPVVTIGGEVNPERCRQRRRGSGGTSGHRLAPLRMARAARWSIDPESGRGGSGPVALIQRCAMAALRPVQPGMATLVGTRGWEAGMGGGTVERRPKDMAPPLFIRGRTRPGRPDSRSCGL